jgi:hypothetical protein
MANVVGILLVEDPDPSSADHWASVLAGFPDATIYHLGDTPPEWWSSLKEFKIAISINEVDVPIVVISGDNARELPGTKSLVDFEHPDDVVYLFGGDHTILNTDLPYVAAVYIPSDGAELYSHVAGAIVLYDRMLKRG